MYDYKLAMHVQITSEQMVRVSKGFIAQVLGEGENNAKAVESFEIVPVNHEHLDNPLSGI